MFRNRLKEEHERELKSVRNHRYYLKHKRKERERNPVKPLEITKKEEPKQYYAGEPVDLL